MRHINIPIFIPHAGCPQACVFCDQRRITGRLCEDDVRREIRDMQRVVDEVLTTAGAGDEVEIAFFGGSFTAIDRGRMTALLGAAQPYLESGKVTSLRCSTRPDAVEGEVLEILRRYGMKTVELGIQSLSDVVLAASRRGHDAATALDACRRVREAGFSLVGQMMLGLPRSTVEDERATARAICASGADGVRVYPTAVLPGTELYAMAERGEYEPLTPEDAVNRAADVLEIFAGSALPVIRCGLCETDTLRGVRGKTLGVTDPSFGETARGEVFGRRIREAFGDAEKQLGHSLAGRSATIFCPRGAASAAAGYKRKNKIIVQNEFNIKNIKIQETCELFGYTVNVEIY